MNSFFDVSPEEIRQLDDADLRELVGRLCEAEHRQAGRDAAGVLWGGHQDAPDGGLDVVVRSGKGLASSQYLFRANVGFQVKKPKMQPSKIPGEIVKKGGLRPAIEELAEQSGAYIIVSSGDDCSESALKDRIEQMKKSVGTAKHADRLFMDFVDCSRLATWVRGHPGITLWVKTRVGRTFKGWRPFDRWAYVPKGGGDRYLLDDHVRVFAVGTSGSEGISALEAIENIRSKVRVPGSSTRIAGLSGIGKTRFVQALFEEEIGSNPLDPSSVFYTDIANSPEPDPKSLIEQLISQSTKAVFVLDNCPPELHGDASKSVHGMVSPVSLITVEYDVREDLPPETDVFRLEPSSRALIEQMVLLHHPHVGRVDAQKIAEFAGGNARIADALAATVKLGETVSGLKDEELFNRLFFQRHSPDGDLQRSAEVLSLVYSYDGESISMDSELGTLASIIGQDARKLYTDTATLRERDLVQARSHWRAVLPHALANRLAGTALKKHPPDVIDQTIRNSGSERLVRSLSRRLGYLHDSEHAKYIARKWLHPDAWLGASVHCLNHFGVAVLRNIAPVSPEDTLAAIERAVFHDNGGQITAPDNLTRMEFVYILRSIAYDGELFGKCCDTLVVFALKEGAEGQATDNLAEMFWIALSGTHASPEVRHSYIDKLIQSSEPDCRTIGVRLLEASLKTDMFSSSLTFDFGARPRDHGWEPADAEEVNAWFERFIGYSTELALENHQVEAQVRTVIASKLRGLWRIRGVLDRLEATVLGLHSQRPWPEAWIATRHILEFDNCLKNRSEAHRRLKALEAKLRPEDVIEKTRAYAIADANHILELLDKEVGDNAISAHQRADEITRELAQEMASDQSRLKYILPELIAKQGARIGVFGEGLAQGATDPRAVWQIVSSAVRLTPHATRNIAILLGFLLGYSKRDQGAVKLILDQMVYDDVFGPYFPYFQTAAGIDSTALPRFLRSLDSGKAPIESYFQLGLGRAHEGFTDAELIVLLQRIEREDGGTEVVSDILKMRLFGATAGDMSAELLQFARDFLIRIPLRRRRRADGLHDHDLKLILSHALTGFGGDEIARNFLKRLTESESNKRLRLMDFGQSLAIIADKQPFAFLDEIFAASNIRIEGHLPVFSDWFGQRENPIIYVSEYALIEWCCEDRAARVEIIAREMVFFEKIKGEENYDLKWRKVFDLLLNIAPDRDSYLNVVAATLRPWSWSGDRSDVLKTRKTLVKKMERHSDPFVQQWASKLCSELDEEIDMEIEQERKRQEVRDERFE